MEFNNIQLPAFVIAGLYKHSLVVIDGEIKDGGWQMADGGQPQIEIEAALTIGEQPIIANPNTVIKKQELPITIVQKPDEKYSGTIDFQTAALNEHLNVTKAQPDIAHAVKDIILPTSNFKFLGGFGKKISIVLEDHFHPHINDDDLAFLSKLLQACKLSLNDVAIINVVSNQKFSNQLWQLMPAEKMIIFDIDPGTLGLPFRLSHFKLQPWSDCVFLASPSLQALQEDASEKVVQLKRNLWESLKKMFLA